MKKDGRWTESDLKDDGPCTKLFSVARDAGSGDVTISNESGAVTIPHGHISTLIDSLSWRCSPVEAERIRKRASAISRISFAISAVAMALSAVTLILALSGS